MYWCQMYSRVSQLYIYICVCVYTYTYVHMYICKTYVYVYIHTYIYIYIYILFQILFPFRLLEDTEYSSLCYIVGPSWLSVLRIVSCTC